MAVSVARRRNPTFADQIREVDLRPPPRLDVKRAQVSDSKSEPRAATYNGDGSMATL